MTPRELHSGASFEIPLETYSSRFIGELHNCIDYPRSILGCVWAASGVVRVKPRSKIGGETGVIARRLVRVLQDVDDALRCFHAHAGSKRVTANLLVETGVIKEMLVLGAAITATSTAVGGVDFCDRRKVGLPTVAQEVSRKVHLRSPEFLRATVDNLRLEPERRLVDQTGIEPVTS